MRFRRLVLPLLAAVAMTAAMLATPAPSSAAETRPVSVRSGEIRNTGTFYVKGVAQDWRQKYVYLQKKTCRSCNYRTLKKDLTGTGGAYYFKFGGRVGDCFRLYIRAAGGYKTVQRGVGCIVRG